MSFDQYLATGLHRNCVNYPLYTDEDDETVLVDRIMHFEELQQGLTEIFEQLKIPWNGDLGVRAKSGYRKDKQPYQEIYTEAQQQMIERAFQWECRHLGYTYSGDSI